MTEQHDNQGSLWRRWDLHIHSPGTKLSNAFGEPTPECLERYVRMLEESQVEVFGITDYFSFDGYNTIVQKYDELFPEGRKLFIPNIEFRLTESVSRDATNLNAHLLLDPATISHELRQDFLVRLDTHLSDGVTNVRCSNLAGNQFEQATVSLRDLIQTAKDVFPGKASYLLVLAANNEGLHGVDTRSARSLTISDEIDKHADAFFGSPNNVEYFLRTDRYEGALPSIAKPVFSGSDAHSFEDLERLQGDTPNFEPTWIKADLTFRGLYQTLYEPKGRVHIGEQPTVLGRLKKEATQFISKLDVDQCDSYGDENGEWFKNVSIPLNPELTAIIGNKGSGKSAIADIIGLLGDSRQHQHFSFLTDGKSARKFRQKGFAENFKANLEWESGTTSEKLLSDEVDLNEPEKVKYLPQNYFESLTNEIEVREFRREIEEVVFSHIDESDRLGKSSFDELEDLLTSQTKTEISSLKTKLRELNIEIVELERKSSPDHKARLQASLKSKNEEYKVLEKSKPETVDKPEDESPEQEEIESKLAPLLAKKASVVDKISQLSEREVELKSDLQKLGTVKSHLQSLEGGVQEEIETHRELYASLGLDIAAIITFSIDNSTIETKLQTTQDELKILSADYEGEINATTDISTITSLAGLRQGNTYLTSEIETLQNRLSAPQRRYQKYLAAMDEINAELLTIMGEEDFPKPGTIKDLEQSIAEIDGPLSQNLATKRADRLQLCERIFQQKSTIRTFYEDLKARVHERLEIINSIEFAVTIDASFVLDHTFADAFLSRINKSATGEFKGTADGRNKLESLIGDIDWNDFENVSKFTQDLVEKLHENPIDKQVTDIKELYDYLFSFEYFEARYELRLGGKNLNQLSPGEKGLLLLVFYLHLDKEKTPLIIDQPEDNLDNDSIFSVLAQCIREAKKLRQVILVTHNPNLAIGADAEEIIYVHLDKADSYKFTYETGAIEQPRMTDLVVKVLEGSKPAFVQRRLKYQIA